MGSELHEDPMKAREDWNEATFRRGDNIDRLLVMDVTDLGWVWTPHIIHYTLHYACQGNKEEGVT